MRHFIYVDTGGPYDQSPRPPTMSSDFEYKFKPPPEEWSEDMKVRFRQRFVDVKGALLGGYEKRVSAGELDTETAASLCLRETLRTVARELGLTLLTFHRRQ
jgi:hypothetical protein